jgi:hypothetical protein
MRGSSFVHAGGGFIGVTIAFLKTRILIRGEGGRTYALGLFDGAASASNVGVIRARNFRCHENVLLSVEA